MHEYLIKYEEWFGIKDSVSLWADNKKEAEELFNMSFRDGLNCKNIISITKINNKKRDK